MKKLLFAAAICTAAFYACNSEESKTGSDKPAVTDETTAEDSAKKALEREAAQMRQDSIEAQGIKKYVVKKLEGKHKYGGLTEVEYKSMWQYMDEERAKAKKEMQKKEDLETSLDFIRRQAKGGQIMLHVERGTIGAANLEMFTVIVKDTAENELFREEYDNDIPEVPSSGDGDWWNYGYCYIPTPVKAPFYIYVVDRLQDGPFKYLVTPVKK